MGQIYGDEKALFFFLLQCSFSGGCPNNFPSFLYDIEILKSITATTTTIRKTPQSLQFSLL